MTQLPVERAVPEPVDHDDRARWCRPRTESDGQPPGVSATGLKVLFDSAQETAVVLQYFESAEDMEAGAQVFSAMDPSETPGTRASVDMCELQLERTLT